MTLTLHVTMRTKGPCNMGDEYQSWNDSLNNLMLKSSGTHDLKLKTPAY